MIMKKLVKNFSESELKELEGKWLFRRVDYNFDGNEVEDEDTEDPEDDDDDDEEFRDFLVDCGYDLQYDLQYSRFSNLKFEKDEEGNTIIKGEEDFMCAREAHDCNEGGVGASLEANLHEPIVRNYNDFIMCVEDFVVLSDEESKEIDDLFENFKKVYYGFRD